MERINMKHISALAGVKLNPEEERSLGKDLEQMISFFQALERVNTQGVEPLPCPLDTSNVSRGDREEKGISREKALSNAPDHTKGFFRVPSIIEET